MKWNDIIPTKQAEVLDFLLENPMKDYTITAIADNVNITRPTLYTLLPKMRKNGLITTRVMGKLILHGLEFTDPRIQLLIKFNKENPGDLV